MIVATSNDEPIVINILTSSFEENKSVNYVVGQGGQKKRRIRLLMEYSFRTCLQFGNVFLSDDKKGCALVLYPDKQKTNLQTMLREIKLVTCSIGIGNIYKTIKREAAIKKRHPSIPFSYLWFIGVCPKAQGIGVGSTLLTQFLQYSQEQNRNVFLETSTLINLPWYKRFGFQLYDELDLGFKLFFLKRT